MADRRLSVPPPNRWERAWARVAPSYAQRIYRARIGFAALAGGYTGARRDRRATKEWAYTAGSPNSDLLGDLPALRERARDLVRNNPLARGAVNTAVTSVVGTGLKLRARVDRDALGLEPEAAREFERRAERLFWQWSEDGHCDFAETETFTDLQATVYRSRKESGDCLALLRYRERAGSPFGLAVQLVEGDRLSNPNHAQDRAELMGGVERDPASGAPIAYHVASAHPGDMAIDRRALVWTRIPMRDVTGQRQALLLFDRLRPDQARGEPYLAPVIEALKQLGRYTDAELAAAVVTSFFAVFTKTVSGQGLAPNSGTVETDTETGAPEIKLGAAGIVPLRTGEEVSSTTPGRPNQAFDPFVLAVLRQIGVALEIPYEILTKHFTSSYSAARAALLEAWRYFRRERTWLARRFCQPVYEAFLADCVARGLLAAPGFFADPLARAAWGGAVWIGDAPGQIDPTKETAAAEQRMNNLLSSRAEETMQITGRDWEEVVEEVAAEREYLAGLGLQSAPGPAPGENERDEDGADDEDAPARDAAAVMAAGAAGMAAKAVAAIGEKIDALGEKFEAVGRGVTALAERPLPAPQITVAPAPVVLPPPIPEVHEHVWDDAGERIVRTIRRPLEE